MTLSSRTTTILAVLLVASFAINFFVAGIFFSHAGRPPHFSMMGPRPENTVFMRGEPRGLSEEGREILRNSLQGQGPSIRAHAEAMSKAQDAIRDALKAKPFDPEALATAQQQARQAVDSIQAAIQAKLAEVAAQLSDEDRAALANMPVQSPMVAFRHRDFRAGNDNDRTLLHREFSPGASTPPAPGEER
jgi:uncharacterized membrane protein